MEKIKTLYRSIEPHDQNMIWKEIEVLRKKYDVPHIKNLFVRLFRDQIEIKYPRVFDLVFTQREKFAYRRIKEECGGIQDYQKIMIVFGDKHEFTWLARDDPDVQLNLVEKLQVR